MKPVKSFLILAAVAGLLGCLTVFQESRSSSPEKKDSTAPDKSVREISAEPEPSPQSNPAASPAAVPALVAEAPRGEHRLLIRGEQKEGKAAAPDPVVPDEPKFDPRFEQPATKMKLFGIGAEERAAEVARLTEQASREKAEAIAWAVANGQPIKGTTASGGTFEIMRMEDGKPVYNQTNNANARISHNVDSVIQIDQWPSGGGNYNLTGFGWTVGLWEQGPPRLSHNEFTALALGRTDSRVTYLDPLPSELTLNVIEDHATHVLGTIIGNGYGGDQYRGMAWLAEAKAYNWDNDSAEMLAVGATAPGQPDKVYVSNHSYGKIVGWAKLKNGNEGFFGIDQDWTWHGSAGESEARDFGVYDASSASWDRVCYKTPYYLPFKAAGNDRGEEPPALAAISWNGNTGTWGFAPSAPDQDGGDDGWDTLPTYANAKNIVTVGNMEDAVSGGVRSTSGVGMVASSGYGPADDGRIKPDLVGNGYQVESATKNSDSSYGEKTGTSMASPGLSGTGLLLHQHYKNKTGQTMRASTLKALMIHTATDVFNAGPDYKSGWGLVDGQKAVDHIDRHASNPGNYHIYEDYLSTSRKEIRLAFQANTPVKATLVWTDPPGSEKSGLDNRTPVLVNDLDITLRAPNGTIYRSPQLNYANPDALPSYAAGNSLDTVEQIGGGGQLIVAQAGIYELVISYKGTLSELALPIPADKKQVFSLMLQGNVPDTIGTLAQAVDLEDRQFTNPAPSANASFLYQHTNLAADFDRAVSSVITHNEKAGFETTVTGPTTLNFLWGVSSEVGYDFLRFYDNGTQIAEISGDLPLAPRTYEVPAGTHTLRWSYEKDSSLSSGSDSGWVDEIHFNNFADGIDNFDYVWTPVNAIYPWDSIDTTVTAIPTGDIARSADVQYDQFSEMRTTITGPALVQFTLVQTAPNGALRADWPTGTIVHNAGNAYRRYSALLPSGPNTFTISWRNPLDENGYGYLDDFVVTPLPGDGTLNTAAEISNLQNYPLTVVNASDAAWVPDEADAAPSGPNGEPGNPAIHTVFIPAANYPNSTNNSTLQHTVQGPALLSFWWQCTGATDGNLAFLIQQVGTGEPYHDASPSAVGPRRLEPITGGTGWQQVHYEVPPGLYNVRWQYTAGANDAEGAAWLDQVTVQPHLMAPARGLDHWSQAWETYGDADWAASYDDSNGGIDSTSHGDLLDSESTTLSTTVVGPKKLFFDWKVSSEVNFDFMRFTMDGEEMVSPISGSTEWTTVEIDIPGGNHVLRWTYSKDGSLSTGDDRGWVDRVAILRPDFGIASITKQPGSGFSLLGVRKDPTAGFFLESSDDLVNWTVIGANESSLNGSGMIPPHFETYTSITPASPGALFYRLRFEPEVVIDIENADFESPLDVNPSQPYSQFGPGWTSDGDAFGETVFEYVDGFSASGRSHFSVNMGTFAEMKDEFFSYNGIVSVAAAIGNRSGFTMASNKSTVSLVASGSELRRITHYGFEIPAGTFEDGPPLTWDFFTGGTSPYSDFKVRLTSEGSRSNFDNIRVVTEPK